MTFKFILLAAISFGFSSAAEAKSRIGFALGGYRSVKASAEEDGMDLTYEDSGISVGSTGGFKIGYQVSSHVELGGGISVASNTLTEEITVYGESAEIETDSSSTAFGIYMDFNITPDSALVWYVGPRFTYETTKTESESSKTDTKSTRYGAGAGLKYFVTPAISTDFGISYQLGSLDLDVEGADTRDFDLNVLGVGLGISVWL